MGTVFARGTWNSQATELCKSNALNINHLELLSMAIAVDLFSREGLLPPDNRTIVIRGDNIDARDIANKWTAEGPVMYCILRILHNTCEKRHVRMWMLHVSTTDNDIADGLSRSPDFQTSSPELRNSEEVNPPKELTNWMKLIVKTARSEAAQAHNDYTAQRLNEELNDENVPNDSNRNLAL